MHGGRRAGGRDVAVVAAPVVLVGLALATRGTEVFRVLAGEDAVLEWLQVGALLVAAVAAAGAARRSAGARRLVAAGLAAGCAVAVGEELAWGGRLLDVSGTALQERNEQGETTLHNVGGGLEATFAVTALLGATGAVAALADRLPGVPRAVAAWFGAAAVAAVARLVVTDPSYEEAKLTEVTELLLYAAVAWAAIGLRAATGRAPRQAASVPAPDFSFARRRDSRARSPRSSP